MPNLTAPAGPRTITVPGNGTNTLSVVLPPGVTLDVQAVLANIDATAAGDTIAELTIAEQAGVIIAAKRQSDAIPAGDTGSATWALRLDDEAVDASLLTTDGGVVTINPTKELLIDGGLALANLGAGIARVSAVAASGIVTGWLYASLGFAPNRFVALGVPNYGPLWGGGTQETHGSMAGVTLTAGAGPPAFSRFTLAAGAYLIWYSTFTNALGYPRLTWTFVNAHEVGYLLDTQEVLQAGAALGEGACVRFAKLTGNKTFTTSWSSPPAGNPNAGGQAFMVILRLSL